MSDVHGPCTREHYAPMKDVIHCKCWKGVNCPELPGTVTFEQAPGPSPAVKAEMFEWQHGLGYRRRSAVLDESLGRMAAHRPQPGRYGLLFAALALIGIDILAAPAIDIFFQSDLVAGASVSGGTYLDGLAGALIFLACLILIVSECVVAYFALIALMDWFDDL